MKTAKNNNKAPGLLFLQLYAQASTWSSSERASAHKPDTTFSDLCARFLNIDAGVEAYDKLLDLVQGKRFDKRTLRGRVLAALIAIDKYFYSIHPRAVLAPSSALSSGFPTWLRDARANRSIFGEYTRSEDKRLIARGPLSRQARDAHASSGDYLADHFSSLATVPFSVEHDGRRIKVLIQVVGPSPVSGVVRGRSPGSETVGFLPVATATGELEANPVTRSGRLFAAYGPAPSFEAARAALNGILELGGIDIVLMPELTFTEDHADQLAENLTSNHMPVARLIVSGTYSTTCVSEDGQPWNECRILNGLGAEIWRQRKLWPAGISQKTALSYRLPDPGSKSLTLEDNASGEELIIADVDNLGRCVVLICQDIETPVMAAEIALLFQPDWIFTPIFDISIDDGRWAHSRSFALSSLSPARFLAVTNTAFAKADASPKNMGLAVGPKQGADPSEGEPGRVVAIIAQPDPPAHPIASIQWRSGNWHQSWLGSKPIARR